MESDRLSSSTTYLWKYLYAPFWILLPICVTIAFVGQGETKAWFGTLGALFCVVFAYCKFGKVRHVDLQDEHFLISDLGRRYEVPVSQLQRVDGGSWIHPDTVKLYFKDDTGFGKRVDFVAHWSLWSGLEEHPVVDELDRLIQRRRSDRLLTGA
ncbi:hypothetical protein [Pseudoxanthomonas sacheonensis]|uniref:Toxin CptA n=1 Tax=Pseudoxanthomonas sacheonensis TaxID=443615 RepID=A0ABU1RQY1_9GAMM|nr:hypothetical protein [Pseudoxanthomonas sacheonensis]MDR6841196.1 hypothetical protein [Pseudoxanthomonas sacheonensis]